jgi:hypothetical protein
MLSSIRLSVTLALVSSAGFAFAAESIVGRWAPTASMCNQPGAITVGPKSLVGEDFYCRFDTVSRNGSVVTWKGRCEAGDEERPRTAQAKLTGKKLSYRYKGVSGWSPPYVRCAK